MLVLHAMEVQLPACGRLRVVDLVLGMFFGSCLRFKASLVQFPQNDPYNLSMLLMCP